MSISNNLYKSPAIEVVDLVSNSIVCTSYKEGGQGLKFDNVWDDITFFEED